MSKFMNVDFVIKYNPKKDSVHDLTRKVMYGLFIRRLKLNKPVNAFICGDSGEGKSESALSIIEELMIMQGLNIDKYFQDINVFNPITYSNKLNKILHEKELKKVQMLVVHEARDLVKAKNWHSFINTTISDVNTMARQVKKMMYFVISQFIKDIDTNMRYTLTHYIKVTRPNSAGKNARMHVFKMWKDDRDIEKPKLRKRRIKILLMYPDGKTRLWIPKYMEIPRPSKKIRDLMQKADKEEKSKIIKKKLKKLEEEMRGDIGVENGESKTEQLIDFYTQDIEKLQQIMIKKNGRWTIDKSFQKILDLDKKQFKKLKDTIKARALEKGLIGDKDG